MSRFTGWWREHPVRSDALLAAVLLALDVSSAHNFAVPTWLWVLTAVLLVGPVVVRRSQPRPAAVVVLLGGALWVTTHVEPMAFHFGVVTTFVFTYTLLVYRGARDALV